MPFAFAIHSFSVWSPPDGESGRNACGSSRRSISGAAAATFARPRRSLARSHVDPASPRPTRDYPGALAGALFESRSKNVRAAYRHRNSTDWLVIDPELLLRRARRHRHDHRVGRQRAFAGQRLRARHCRLARLVAPGRREQAGFQDGAAEVPVGPA